MTSTLGNGLADLGADFFIMGREKWIIRSTHRQFAIGGRRADGQRFVEFAGLFVMNKAPFVGCA